MAPRIAVISLLAIRTPEILATHKSDRDENGIQARIDRHEINKEELYQACLEAPTNKFEYVLGSNKEECVIYSEY